MRLRVFFTGESEEGDDDSIFIVPGIKHSVRFRHQKGEKDATRKLARSVPSIALKGRLIQIYYIFEFRRLD